MASRVTVGSRRKDSCKSGENFVVSVRVRPLIAREINSNSAKCVEVDTEHNAVSITKPESRRRSSHIGIDDLTELVRSDQNMSHDFFYDIVFGPSSTQEMIFDHCVKDIVESVLGGYNGSIIASGQTGSGKTFTIEGGQGDYKGIIPRAIEQIFQFIEMCPRKNDRFLVRTSFLEIYNEKIGDLLDRRRENLKIREDGVGGVYVESLSEHVVRNTDGVMSLLREGAQLRTTASTRMNKESSRSHAVFTVIVEHAEYDSSGGSVVTIGKLRLVDLAGSERLDIEAQSKLQEETKNINVSLHTFGKVVTALTTPGSKYVPYRDSKLTRLLQDCLGGNCKTTLIATITPVETSYTESLNTLKFAKRAKKIKNMAIVNKDISQKALLSAYQQEIKKLKQQLEHRESGDDDRFEVEKLEKEMKEAKKEKDEVLSQLKAHQKFMSEASKEREQLLDKISHLQTMLLHGGNDVSETAEFKKAVEEEQARIRSKTEAEFQTRMAELEAEKKRLESERLEIQKQREYFSKLRSDFQPDGGRDEHDGGTEDKSGKVGIKKPGTAPSSLSSRPPPPGAHIPLAVSAFPPPPRRIGSADSLPSGAHPYQRHGGWVHQQYDTTSRAGVGGLQTHVHLDDVSATALAEYAHALAHPTRGIPSQELVSGVRIFTGSDCVKWFLQNMVGVSSMQAAQDVGQRLMDLNVFMEIQGQQQFIVSDTVYYQFCDPNLTAPSSSTTIQPPPASLKSSTRRHSTQSLPYEMSYQRSRAGSNQSLQYTAPSVPGLQGQLETTWGMGSSSMSLTQSVSSLQISGDLLSHFGLSQLSPTDLHSAAIYGDRTKLKVLSRELSVDCLDTAGHTPLMYAVLGKQTKCCLQLIRLGANVNAANQDGQTPLLLASAAEYDDIIKLLLKHGALTHFIDQEGRTAFHLAAQSSNHKCLEYLCKYASEHHGIEERDHHYQTPLHVAVNSNKPPLVKLLLSNKVELGTSDDNGRTALHYAVMIRSLECAKAIVSAVPNDINLVDKVTGSSALHLACTDNYEEMMSCLMACPKCDINLKDSEGRSPLHVAVLSNSVAAVKMMVSKGASTNAKDNHGKTPLHDGVQLGHTECVRAIRMVSN